ncbi:MAG: Smr/MutS family protein [Thermodesulfobacteriota bacterium]
MPTGPPAATYRPFDCLSALKAPSQGAAADSRFAALGADLQRLAALHNSDDDPSLFRRLMHDVEPFASPPGLPKRCGETPVFRAPPTTRQELRRLVDEGRGFVVSLTPEYLQGRAVDVAPTLVARLRDGEFAIQAHLDLHGYGAADAAEIFHRFLDESVARGLRTLLIIHGRGLSSAAAPVLKGEMVKWLCRGRWRRWVMAFASSPAVHGGAGATCVLLRRRPRAGKIHVRCDCLPGECA